MTEPVGGVCLIKNVIDIIPALVGHYLRLGFDRIIFFDDNSTDGTYVFLKALSRRDPRVSVKRIVRGSKGDPVRLHRGEDVQFVNEMVNRLIANGVKIVFPFDSDEFWNINLDSIRKLARSGKEGVFEGSFAHFVQHRSARDSTPINLLRARRRAPVLKLGPMDSVAEYQNYLCFTKKKVGFRSTAPVELGWGNHWLTVGPKDFLAKGLELFHLALRSAAEVDVRADRIIGNVEYWRGDGTREGREAVWAANSADADGCLSTVNGPIMLIPDDRLRTLIARAMFYLIIRHPLLVLRAAYKARRVAQTRRRARAEARPIFAGAAEPSLEVRPGELEALPG